MESIEYVLVATTRGDELIPSQRKVVATSDSSETLEQLRDKRAKEREEWIANTLIPWWQECSLIASEEIEEVSRV